MSGFKIVTDFNIKKSPELKRVLFYTLIIGYEV